MQDKELSKKEVQHIQSLAREKLNEYCKWNDIIGTEIFSILEKESKVLYYPLEDPQVWGFSERIKGKFFVCINTSLPYDKQIFAAAHELYHIWFGSFGEVMISEDTQELSSDKEEELFANRFAAEFLVNEELLRQEMRVFGISVEQLDVKTMVRLANLFLVPYRTMAKRLYEIDVLSKKDLAKLLTLCTEQQADIWRSRLGLSVPVRKDTIGLSNLVDKALEAYERHLITYERLEYLLEFARLTPKAMGVERESVYQPPTDEELDAIMEE